MVFQEIKRVFHSAQLLDKAVIFATSSLSAHSLLESCISIFLDLYVF